MQNRECFCISMMMMIQVLVLLFMTLFTSYLLLEIGFWFNVSGSPIMFYVGNPLSNGNEHISYISSLT